MPLITDLIVSGPTGATGPTGIGATGPTGPTGLGWRGAWSEVTAYVPGDFVSLDGAQWVCVLANTAVMPLSPDYRTATLSRVPAGYWRVGEPSGVTATDEMGANDGTYVNSPTLGVAGLLAGDSDTAADFDGTLGAFFEHVLMPGPLIAATHWTLLAWCKPASLPQASKRILTSGTDANGASLAIGNGGGGSGSQLSLLLGGVAWLDCDWTFPDTASAHMVAATRDATTIRCYVDGAPTAATFANTPLAATTRATIAVNGDLNAGNFDGTIDEPAAWDRALTPAEIAGLNAVGTGTVYWEQIGASTAADIPYDPEIIDELESTDVQAAIDETVGIMVANIFPLLPGADAKAALDAANLPTAENPFATMDDLRAGPTGPTRPTGVGATGPTGIGATGPTGPTGAGPTGPTGPAGPSTFIKVAKWLTD